MHPTGHIPRTLQLACLGPALDHMVLSWCPCRSKGRRGERRRLGLGDRRDRVDCQHLCLVCANHTRSTLSVQVYVRGPIDLNS